jgi:serine phosphatase RsbU (regulator of sigma subunit)/anti-sigma regulatory factor (Ser/Thr protein kinase)
VAQTGNDELQAGSTPNTSDRAEGLATLIALLWVTAVAAFDTLFKGKFGLFGFMTIGPFIAAAFARPRRTALVGVVAAFFSIVLITPGREYGELNHVLRVITEVASASLAVWISRLRSQRNIALWTARSETRNERRRRVAAETAQRMQALARALTTAADPAQVADAVFAALRDELRVDAATFATVTDRGVLHAHRRFGYDAAQQKAFVLSAMDPDGAIGDVLLQNVALFAESVDDLRQEWPAVAALLASDRFSSLALVPMVVSDHAVGVVVVHWVKSREITKVDKSFMFAITGAAAQAVERARLTVTEFANLERSQHLHQLSSGLAAATTPAGVAEAAITVARRALRAQSGVVRVPAAAGGALACLAGVGQPPLLSQDDIDLDGTASGSSFTEGRTEVTFVGVGQPATPRIAPELDPAILTKVTVPISIVAEPLIGSTGALGVLSLAFVPSADLGDPEYRFLSTLAGLTAQALERAEVFEQERRALREAQAGRERLSLLSEVTRLLSSSLEPATVIQRTISLVEGRLADACQVQVPSENGLQRLDGGGEPIPFESDAPAAVAYRTGRIQRSPAPGPGGSDPGGATALLVPLMASGAVIGIMSFVDQPGRAFERDDESLALEVASRTAVALSNANRFQREHVVAEVLQRAVLPDSLPTVGGLHFDAEYRAGAAGTYVGGDWYDVFSLDDQTIFFSVGDVMGKGAPAAALMGQVRSAIRAYAVAGQSPSEVLSSLDVLFDSLVEDRVVTVVVGSVNPTTGATTLANAGHPPPLVVRADGTSAFSSTRDSLLIAAGLGGSSRPSQEYALTPGDSLIMYSDGLIERRGELITLGMERLVEAATAMAGDGWPENPAAVFASMLSDDECTDDVVVLSLDFVGPTSEGREVSPVGKSRDGMKTLRLEPVVESTPMARHWVNAHLREFPTEVSECAAFLTSELVTNAVLHAGTPLLVTLHLLEDRIRVDVADGSPVVPRVKDYGTDAATGRGLTLFTTLASNWGVQAVDNGKIVWFELDVDIPMRPVEMSNGAFRFDLVGVARSEGRPADQPSPAVPVALLGIPVALLQKASEEYEGVFREIRLMKEHAAVQPQMRSSVPERLAVAVSDIGVRFHGLGPGMDQMWQDAVDRHLESYDWRISLPTTALGSCELYSAMLDEADEFVRTAGLLTQPASATSIAVRSWFLAELIGQLQGAAPVPWSASRFHADLHAGLPSR